MKNNRDEILKKKEQLNLQIKIYIFLRFDFCETNLPLLEPQNEFKLNKYRLRIVLKV